MPYREIRDEIDTLAKRAGRDPAEITLVTISKQRPNEQIQSIYNEGCRIFGENRIQEFQDKAGQLPEDISWHFIGTLQSNKVTKTVGQFALIHSVTSPKLASRIDRVSKSMDVLTSILLQINTSKEPSKHGLSVEQWRPAIEEVLTYDNLVIEGLMTMGPATRDPELTQKSFESLRLFLEELKPYRSARAPLHHLSMGMTSDFPIAIEEGATILRIGTAIFSQFD